MAQVHGLGDPSEEGVGGAVDRAARELGRGDLAADAGVGIDDHDIGAGLVAEQGVGGGQSADPRADDDGAASTRRSSTRLRRDQAGERGHHDRVVVE